LQNALDKSARNHLNADHDLPFFIFSGTALPQSSNPVIPTKKADGEILSAFLLG